MNTSVRNRYRPGLGGLIHREWYMMRLDWGLRSLPSKDTRRILRDLRRDVTATAADTGMKSALNDLGTPSLLAQEYTNGVAAGGPRYFAGTVAAGVILAAIAWLLMGYAIGTLDTLDAMGGGTRTATLWGSETLFTHTADQISFEIANILPAFAVLVAICAAGFLLFSRIWRLGRPR